MGAKRRGAGARHTGQQCQRRQAGRGARPGNGAAGGCARPLPPLAPGLAHPQASAAVVGLHHNRVAGGVVLGGRRRAGSKGLGLKSHTAPAAGRRRGGVARGKLSGAAAMLRGQPDHAAGSAGLERPLPPAGLRPQVSDRLPLEQQQQARAPPPDLLDDERPSLGVDPPASGRRRQARCGASMCAARAEAARQPPAEASPPRPLLPPTTLQAAPPPLSAHAGQRVGHLAGARRVARSLCELVDGHLGRPREGARGPGAASAGLVDGGRGGRHALGRPGQRGRLLGHPHAAVSQQVLLRAGSRRALRGNRGAQVQGGTRRGSGGQGAVSTRQLLTASLPAV